MGPIRSGLTSLHPSNAVSTDRIIELDIFVVVIEFGSARPRVSRLDADHHEHDVCSHNIEGNHVDIGADTLVAVLEHPRGRDHPTRGATGGVARGAKLVGGR